ncbi:esterase/lipase family protein [Tundrisphaera lichenicola]|uniref:esterase/lipase family protein n=1 Tax=Tundrisphaera lichenicola TaxID=2029860 RepID=UPI003EB7F42E
MITASLSIALALVTWTDVAVSPNRGDKSHSSIQRSLAGLDRPSDRTIETLKRFALDSKYRRDPSSVLETLAQQARAHPEPDLVYALAELSWIESRKTDRRHRGESNDRALDALSYAYDYLFAPELAIARQPSDPRYRLACDLYNGSLDHLVREAQSNGVKIEAGEDFSLKIRGKEQIFKIVLRNSPWSVDDIDQVYLASAFDVSGLPTLNYQYGLGVPLIAVRISDKNAEGVEAFYPREMAFPLTAFLVPASRLRDDGGGDLPRELSLELVDPLRTRTVGLPPMPIESDLTTPLAYMWSRAELNHYRWTGLLRPGPAAGRAGLRLIRPYEPGKIPVVMVHGLASSPLAWVAMVNDLLRDPRIQERYQFMLYLYPTGIPIPIAAAGLRETLGAAETTFRLEDGSPDPAFHRMILLGHSMGGLLSHAVASNSDEKFWELNTYVPFPQIKGPPEVLASLKRFMFFDAHPFVRRVVFLATPHRGSEMSRGVVGRISSNLISEPDHINELLARLVRDNSDAFPRRFRRLPTSIDTLDPDSPYLKALLAMRPGENVEFHSIIGSLRPEGKQNTTDGVVSYLSSHFDGAKSELVVQSDHGVQNNPFAIMEVHRILLEHVGIVPQTAAAPMGRTLE